MKVITAIEIESFKELEYINNLCSKTTISAKDSKKE